MTTRWVDLADFFLFAEAFGSSDRRFDLDGSGSVDTEDFFLFVQQLDPPPQAKPRLGSGADRAQVACQTSEDRASGLPPRCPARSPGARTRRCTTPGSGRRGGVYSCFIGRLGVRRRLRGHLRG